MTEERKLGRPLALTTQLCNIRRNLGVLDNLAHHRDHNLNTVPEQSSPLFRADPFDHTGTSCIVLYNNVMPGSRTRSITIVQVMNTILVRNEFR